MTTVICKQRNKGFESKRSTAIYCSSKCRKLAFQTDAKNAKDENAKVTVLNKPEQSGRSNHVSEPVVAYNPAVVGGRAEGTGSSAKQDQPKQHFTLEISRKRGLEIECFEDLPEDVQKEIVMSAASKAGNDEELYQRERRERTARAIDYQHVFPGRF